MIKILLNSFITSAILIHKARKENKKNECKHFLIHKFKHLFLGTQKNHLNETVLLSTLVDK